MTLFEPRLTMNCDVIEGNADWLCSPRGPAVLLQGFSIPLMLLCKWQVKESLTLHIPRERASK